MAKKGAKKRPRKTIPKSKDNLQSVIVSKSVAPTKATATKIARTHARKIYTSRETKASWRFRQRPPEDFVKGSFRTFKVPGEGVSLVYGALKRGNKNPDGDVNYRQDVKAYRELEEDLESARGIQELAEVARDAHSRLRSNALLDQVDLQIARHAKRLGKRFVGDAYEISRQVREYGQREIFENPGKMMPDPGACAWLGDLIEWKWKNGKEDFMWENGRQKWLFLWSPKMKAVIGIPKPKKMPKQSEISRKDGAAKMAERFNARKAKGTHEIEIPNVQLTRLGKAIHIVYRSDKWNPALDVDYIHDFKDGVELSCGPNLKNPQIFLCRGGKLTVTERGLVF